MSFGQEIKDFIGAFQATNKIFQDDQKLDLERQRLLMQTNYWASKQAALTGKGAGETTADPATAAGDAARQRYYGGSGGGGNYSTPGIDDPQASSILGFIRQHESANNYDNAVGGAIPGLSNMTIAQVYGVQDRMKSQGRESTAVGGYQTIKPTLQAVVQQLGLDPNTTKFTKDVQDRIGLQLLANRGYNAFKSGKMSQEGFMHNLSQEWAALPKDQSGRSYYAGVGSNRAGASWQQFANAFTNYGSTVAAAPEAAPDTTTAATPAVPTTSMSKAQINDGLRKNGILKDGVQPAAPATTPAVPSYTSSDTWGEKAPAGNKDPTGQDIPEGYHWENGTILPDNPPDEQQG